MKKSRHPRQKSISVNSKGGKSESLKSSFFLCSGNDGIQYSNKFFESKSDR